MEIVVDDKKIALKFNFKAIRIFGEGQGLKNYPEVIELIQQRFATMQNLSWEDEDILLDFIYAAAIAAGSENADFVKEMSLMDFLMTNREAFNQMINELTSSLRAPEQSGKQPARKTTPRKMK